MPHTLLVCQLSTISKKRKKNWKIRDKLSNFDYDNKSHFLHLLRFRICSSILCSNFILFLLQQLQLYYYMQKVASAGMGNPKERKECPICSKTLYDRSTWNRHMRIHTGMCISFNIKSQQETRKVPRIYPIAQMNTIYALYPECTKSLVVKGRFIRTFDAY